MLPFGRFRLKPAMLGRAIREDSAMPYIGLENTLAYSNKFLISDEVQ
jgi:hypothetical protein